MPTGRVWVLNHYASGPDSTHGTRHYDLGRQLVKLGWDVTIFASSFDHHRRQDIHGRKGTWLNEETHEGVAFLWLRTFPYTKNDWRRGLNAISYFAQVLRTGLRRKAPDVIIGSSVHLLAPLAGYLLARFHRARFVFEVRDLWPQTLIDLGKMSPTNPAIRVLRVLEKFLYNRADTIVVLLPKAGDYIGGLGIPTEKVLYLPNGADLARYDRANAVALPAAVNEVISRHAGKFLAVYTGAHGVPNHLDVLVETARLLQRLGNTSIVILLVGNGTEKARLKESAERSSLRNMVFLDPISKAQVPALLSVCHAGLISMVPSPLYNYGISPNKIFDYMAAGLPIVMTGTAACNPVEEYECGVVLANDDAEATAAALIELENDPQRARYFGEHGVRAARERFASERLATVLAEALG